MCGILGGFFNHNRKNITEDFLTSLKYLNHRGPDDLGQVRIDEVKSGALHLGHTRLSILDLSSAGHQPMVAFDDSMTLVFNGEIFNYKEIRKELIDLGYNFYTETDTEVLLNAFHCWGLKSLSKFIGMFAFALCDKVNGKLYLCRDAFGIKPLYYSFINEELIFASEVRPIVELNNENITFDLQSAYDYLVHGVYGHNSNSFFNEIKQVLPATMVTFDLHSKKILDSTRWWEPNYKVNEAISFEEATQKLRELFLQNVKLHLRSDVPLGAALSGGIDSSAIACAMRELEPSMEINTFSYIAKDSDKSEEKWVDLVNEHINAVPHKIESSAEELLQDIDRLIEVQGEPFASTSIYAQFKVFEKVKQSNITVTLDGQGADELLAGYDGYPGYRILSLLEKSKFLTAFSFVKDWSKQPSRSWSYAIGDFLRQVLPQKLYRFLWKLKGREFEPEWLNMTLLKQQNINFKEDTYNRLTKFKGRRVIEKLHSALSQRGLPKLLRHGDRNSMAFSIESRIPFLTTDMADFLFSLPESYLISQTGDTKSVFREAMRGIVPDAILDRKDKIGFDPDAFNWKEKYIEKIHSLEFVSEHSIFSKELFEALPVLSERQVWRILNYKIFSEQYTKQAKK